MNKTSITFIGIGILVLAGISYFLLKSPDSQRPADQSQAIASPSISTNPFQEAVFEYKNGKTDPKVVTVIEGQRVRIRAMSDIANEVHFHGYNISADVTPDKEAIIEFTADKTGRFPIELEQLKIEIGVIEVYPK